MSVTSSSPTFMRSVDGMTDAEISDYIEKTCWKSHAAVADFVGGRGSVFERRAALRRAFEMENAADIANEDRIAFNLAEDDALEPFYAIVQTLAGRRHGRDPAISLGDHMRDLAKRIELRLAAQVDLVDEDLQRTMMAESAFRIAYTFEA